MRSFSVRINPEMFQVCQVPARSIRRSQTAVPHWHGEAAGAFLSMSWSRLRLGIWMLAAVILTGPASAQQAALSFAPRADNGWFQVRGWAVSNQVYTLAVSSNLLAWEPVAVLHHVPFLFADPASSHWNSRFYRLAMSPKTATDDWKNQIQSPYDPFISQSGDPVYWVKFAILIDQPYRVFFQDSVKYPFHYDFAVNRLDPFREMTPDEFGKVSQWLKDQRVVLGAVLFGPTSAGSEYGIQFSGKDAYPPEAVAEWFALVKSAVSAPSGTKALYVPAFEQAAAAERDRSFFQSKGITVSSVDRWLNEAGAVCYSYGWALGRLVYVPPNEIDLAYADGRLRPEDILLTDGVPAEIPFVAGVITLSPSTPNSHVAILSGSYRVPFVYPVDAQERDRIRQLAGRKILLRATKRSDRAEVSLFEVDSEVEGGLQAAILALKRPGPARITPKARYGAISAPVNDLVPSDIRFFGGKAANFGLLRRTIPDNSPDAIAFSFDLWDDFLDQPLPSGRSLRDEIAARLGAYHYPPDITALRNSLAGVRDLITRTARFSDSQKQVILAALTRFVSQRKIRFRSSTNVEDDEQFTGAGLYDSFSGCLADDLDADDSGPSQCDPSEPNERGVLRAMQKVYASFYNDNAFLERLRVGLDESQVGMAVLAHHSFPDEIELANGVATVSFGHLAVGLAFDAELVTQAGAASVTNPDGTSRPERFQVGRNCPTCGGDWDLLLKEGSSLLPLGGTVLGWPEDYRVLMNLFANATAGYASYVPEATDFRLDFEFKKIQPGRLIVKQVRQLPTPEPAEPPIPFLLNEPAEYSVDQNEPIWSHEDVFTTHRLKSKWKLQTRNLQLTETNLASSFYAEAELKYLDGSEIKTLRGLLTSWPDATHSAASYGFAVDQWVMGSSNDTRQFQLTASLKPFDTGVQAPVLTLADFALSFAATDQGRPVESVRLVQTPVDMSQVRVESINLTRSNISIAANVYRLRRNPFPAFPAFGGFKETQIEGLTGKPVVLLGYYSQTRRTQCGAHNCWDEFLFEPRLEPQLPPDISDELRAANIRYIHVYDPADPKGISVGYHTPSYKITLVGFDGSVREIE
jgi:hypothetical protein